MGLYLIFKRMGCWEAEMTSGRLFRKLVAVISKRT